MTTSPKLDKVDKKILEILQRNAKITNAQLSKEIGLSPAPTLERVKKLEQSGVIDSYHAKLNTSKIGLGISTFVQIKLTGHDKESIRTFISAINKIDEVIECHHVTGSSDFILRVIAKDIASYQQLMLDKVNEVPVVDSLQSLVILSTFKDSKALPIPEEEKVKV
ncbi:Lrp/AsnC family transcriptional regulator [Catalinimonas niigatensis]|uniref:Lrp/AsnC family transcriptional regulator n=1 Tax=Catalinimonas niigatensis TaxID=1397264 RepID=UPI002666A5D8|nr:Lrp/AsnC family transcriptional regulator [Catalinimonas niigatensis]WPP52609.1 Lrp/AsnC family transcriptional regulator [Catalinimonas niigatensis]